MTSKRQLFAAYEAVADADIIDTPGKYAISALYDAGCDETFPTRNALTNAVIYNLRAIKEALR